MNESREFADRRPDWTKLPAEYDYLAEAAEQYGHLMALGRALRRRLKASERDELRDLALQIGWHNHDLPIQSWFIQHSIAGDTREVELVEGLLVLLEHLGFDVADYGPKQEPQWTLHQWNTLHYRALQTQVENLREVLPHAQALEVVISALDRVPSNDLGELAFWMLHPFQISRTLDWIESHAPVIEADAHEAFSPRWHWGDLTAVSEFSWPRAESWLGRGRPLSLVALDALTRMEGASESPVVQEVNPKLLNPVPFDLAARIFNGYKTKDQDPKIVHAIESILKQWSVIIGAA